MRLVTLEISGFRGFPEKRVIDLDADAVVIIGANGNGKTSVFDAILWGISGRIPRLSGDGAGVVSLYAEGALARVMLTLRRPTTGESFTITRTCEGTENRISLETADAKLQGPSAQGRLIDLIWPDAGSASDPNEALATVLTRGVYLQQDLIRHFVEAANDHERFTAVSELVGAGRVTELQSSLERSKRAWSTTTNQHEEDLRALRGRLGTIEARVAEFVNREGRRESAISTEAWTQWLADLAEFGITATPMEMTSREAPALIDASIKMIDATRRGEERGALSLKSLSKDLERLRATVLPDVSAMQDRIGTLRRELEDLRERVKHEQDRLAEARRAQAAIKEKEEQLKALAAMALKHLDERCPVCAQEYDKDFTRQRLEAIIGGAATAAQHDVANEELPRLLAVLTEKEKDLSATELGLRSAEQSLRDRRALEDAIANTLKTLGPATAESSPDDAIVQKALANTDTRIQKLTSAQRFAEQAALHISELSASATIQEMNKEAEALWRDIAQRQQSITRRTQTGDLAQRVIEALREASSAVVEERLTEIRPLLQSIYGRIDPHPAFRIVNFLARVVRGKGLLSTVIRDHIENKESELPATVLSSSQVNALAVSVFLSLNMGVASPPLSVAMLDDPLQSLDDINLLGLVDLFRRTKDCRQLFISTHDVRFGGLLARKLRPRNEKERTIVIELDGWSRHGPQLQTREIPRDPEPLRLITKKAS